MARAEAGILPVVLPVADDTDLAGIGVFAATADETRAIMDDDPGVRDGISSYQAHPVRGSPRRRCPSSPPWQWAAAARRWAAAGATHLTLGGSPDSGVTAAQRLERAVEIKRVLGLELGL